MQAVFTHSERAIFNVNPVTNVGVGVEDKVMDEVDELVGVLDGDTEDVGVLEGVPAGVRVCDG